MISRWTVGCRCGFPTVEARNALNGLSVRPENSCGKRGGYERPLVTFSSRVQLDGLPLSWSAVWRVVVHR